jgi:hypothetical protein
MKLQSFLRGSSAESIIEQMANCALALAKSNHDKTVASAQLSNLE